MGKYPGAQTSLGAACYSQERPNWIASASANSRSSLGQERSLQGWAQLYRALWKAVSVGASWSGRGFRWDVSTAVRTIIVTNTVSSPKGKFWLLPEGGAAGKPGRASGVSRAGPWCPLGVSVCPREMRNGLGNLAQW